MKRWCATALSAIALVIPCRKSELQPLQEAANRNDFNRLAALK